MQLLGFYRPYGDYSWGPFVFTMLLQCPIKKKKPCLLLPHRCHYFHPLSFCWEFFHVLFLKIHFFLVTFPSNHKRTTEKGQKEGNLSSPTMRPWQKPETGERNQSNEGTDCQLQTGSSPACHLVHVQVVFPSVACMQFNSVAGSLLQEPHLQLGLESQ